MAYFRDSPTPIRSPSNSNPSLSSSQAPRTQSIKPARLSTHMLDCSANMPKFIVRGTMPTTTIITTTRTSYLLRRGSFALWNCFGPVRCPCHLFGIASCSFQRAQPNDTSDVRAGFAFENNFLLDRD